jgi:enoyl-CoA hydratase/carnithine racemase
MMSEVVVTHEDEITIVRINRFDTRNAINKTTADALREAWLAFDVDENAKLAS